MTKFRTSCWYCGTKLASGADTELEKHLKDNGINHARFLTEVDTSDQDAATTTTKEVPLEEGLQSDPSVSAPSAPASTAEKKE